VSRAIYIPPIDPSQISPPSRSVYALMGDRNIFRMIEDFYAELEASPLRPLFPADMIGAAHKSAAFFVGLLGGPPLYQQRFGNPMMRARHMKFVITPRAREEWLACFERVLAGATERYRFPAEHLPGFRAFLRDFSLWMVNTESGEIVADGGRGEPEPPRR